MFLVCLLLWILFNGRITVEILLFGIAVSALVFAVSCALLGWSFQKDLQFIRWLPGIGMLLLVLVREVVKANLAVVRAIYTGPRQQDSQFVAFDSGLSKTPLRVILGDCITLTPGTITGVLDGNHYTVHCLNQEMADGLEPAVRLFSNRLEKLEDSGEENP